MTTRNHNNAARNSLLSAAITLALTGYALRNALIQ